MLDPKRAVQKRIVLLRGPWFKPDARESTHRLKLGLGDVRIIIPKLLTIPSWPIDHECGQQNERQAKWSIIAREDWRSRRGMSAILRRNLSTTAHLPCSAR